LDGYRFRLYRPSDGLIFCRRRERIDETRPLEDRRAPPAFSKYFIFFILAPRHITTPIPIDTLILIAPAVNTSTNAMFFHIADLY